MKTLKLQGKKESGEDMWISFHAHQLEDLILWKMTILQTALWRFSAILVNTSMLFCLDKNNNNNNFKVKWLQKLLNRQTTNGCEGITRLISSWISNKNDMAQVQNQTHGPIRLGRRSKYKTTKLQAPNIFYLKKFQWVWRAKGMGYMDYIGRAE